jgi:phosphoglycerate dehydrogenase-like enzyme
MTAGAHERNVQRRAEGPASPVTMGEWHASWSPRRSPRAVSIDSAPLVTRWTSQLDLSQLLDHVVGAHALIIRSATQVTAEVLEAGSDLIVVGRAGIGLDNVDVEAATRRGVMVVNAPQSNIVSAAEHTMALLMSQARNVPQAHAALKAGRWERSRWEGVELADKTLGIVGLGRIGKLVADRAKAFGMRLVAYDPFVSADRARQMGVELMALDQLIAEATSSRSTCRRPRRPPVSSTATCCSRPSRRCG